MSLPKRPIGHPAYSTLVKHLLRIWGLAAERLRRCLSFRAGISAYRYSKPVKGAACLPAICGPRKSAEKQGSWFDEYDSTCSNAAMQQPSGKWLHSSKTRVRSPPQPQPFSGILQLTKSRYCGQLLILLFFSPNTYRGERPAASRLIDRCAWLHWRGASIGTTA